MARFEDLEVWKRSARLSVEPQISNQQRTMVSGIKLPVLVYLFRPTPALLNNSESRPPGDVKRNYSDTTKAKTLLNWQPETDLKTGLARTVSFFLPRP